MAKCNTSTQRNFRLAALSLLLGNGQLSDGFQATQLTPKPLKLTPVAAADFKFQSAFFIPNNYNQLHRQLMPLYLSSKDDGTSATSAVSSRQSQQSVPQPLATSTTPNSHWSVYLDESKGLIYYFHRPTYTSQWEPPQGVTFSKKVALGSEKKVEMRKRLRDYLEERLMEDSADVFMEENKRAANLGGKQSSLRKVASSTLDNKSSNMDDKVSNEYLRGVRRKELMEKNRIIDEWHAESENDVVNVESNGVRQAFESVRNDDKTSNNVDGSGVTGETSKDQSPSSKELKVKVLGRNTHVAVESGNAVTSKLKEKSTVESTEEEKKTTAAKAVVDTKIDKKKLMAALDSDLVLKDNDNETSKEQVSISSDSTKIEIQSSIGSTILEKDVSEELNDTNTVTSLSTASERENSVKETAISVDNSDTGDFVDNIKTEDKAQDELDDIEQLDQVSQIEQMEQMKQKEILEEQLFTSSSPLSEPVAPLPIVRQGEWAAYLDGSSGLVYYFHAPSGTSLWDPPTKDFPKVHETLGNKDNDSYEDSGDDNVAITLSTVVESDGAMLKKDLDNVEKKIETTVGLEEVVDEAKAVLESTPTVDELGVVAKYTSEETSENNVPQVVQSFLDSATIKDISSLGSKNVLLSDAGANSATPSISSIATRDGENATVEQVKEVKAVPESIPLTEKEIDKPINSIPRHLLIQNDATTTGGKKSLDAYLGAESVETEVDLKSKDAAEDSEEESVKNLNPDVATTNTVTGNAAKQPAVNSSPPIQNITPTLPQTLNSETLYDILQCQPTATRIELKRSYINLAKQSHPDALFQNGASSNEESELKFAEISQAWKILSDSTSRRRYDRGLRAKGLTKKAGGIFENWVMGAAKVMDEVLAKAEGDFEDDELSRKP